jgi:serine/tyrosine/threonine adenylyltransferase
MNFNFDNTYARLPEKFYERIHPIAVLAPKLVQLNQALAHDLNLNVAHISQDQLAELFSGNKIPEGAEPLAMAYAGHQFAHFSAQLGDGRAHLLGEHVDSFGRRFDIQLKGSGRTRFSRRGDGRAALGPMMREYILGEAMHALGIPSTRALGLVLTGETVMRGKPVHGAVLVRLASSHIRVGTFEFFYAKNDFDAVKLLADYTLSRHFPQLLNLERPYLALFEEIAKAQAKLVASWMHVGFVHGVMNTDNMAVSGETIDYGPCAFLDEYEPMAVFSSIDDESRYAYARQPSIANWNLKQLGICLLKLFDKNEEKSVKLLNSSLEKFPELFRDFYFKGMGLKLGFTEILEKDYELIQDFLNMLSLQNIDYTVAFERLSQASTPMGQKNLNALFADKALFGAWFKSWGERVHLNSENSLDVFRKMQKVNPVVIPRNHQIEKVIAAAHENQDFKPFQKLLEVVSSPFDLKQEDHTFKKPPRSEERVRETYCGT